MGKELEPIEGQAEELTPAKPLTKVQMQAAVLEAAGMEDDRICRLLEVHKKTIGRWRREVDGYSEAVTGYQTKQVQDLTDVVERFQAEYAAVLIKAVRTLGEALDAVHSKAKTPDWNTRLRAAIEAVAHAKLVAPAAFEEATGDGASQGGAAAYIEIKLPDGDS